MSWRQKGQANAGNAACDNAELGKDDMVVHSRVWRGATEYAGKCHASRAAGQAGARQMQWAELCLTSLHKAERVESKPEKGCPGRA